MSTAVSNTARQYSNNSSEQRDALFVKYPKLLAHTKQEDDHYVLRPLSAKLLYSINR